MTDIHPAPSATGVAARPRETELRVTGAIEIARVLAGWQRGPGDPTHTAAAGVTWRVGRTPQGVATIAIRPSTTSVRAAAWGPGAEWAIDQLPALCGMRDDPSGFDPSTHPVLAATHHRLPGLRLGRTDLVFDALAAVIFEQKVTGLQAFRGWRLIVTRHGERAPGPTPRPMFAPPSQWERIPSWDWHRAGVEPPQSRTLVHAAQRRTSIERALPASAPETSARDADRVLSSLPGVGVWTSAETRIRAFGDPDAVSVGDYHLAHEVGYALTGTRTDDDGMLELLAPWAGHRQRVVQLIRAGGPHEPRRGPRLHPEDHRER